VIGDRMKLVGLQEFDDSVHRCSLSRTGYECARATEREMVARCAVCSSLSQRTGRLAT
jgi:hypothetical protein